MHGFNFCPCGNQKKGSTIMKKLLAMLLALSMVFAMAACGSTTETTTETTAETTEAAAAETTEETTEAAETTDAAVIPGTEDGVLTVGMECAYAPYNWTQMDDSNGAVAIANNPGAYANGYDVMIAKKICEAYGWELEIMAIEWDGLTPALNAGTIDAVIAGQSMTETRLAEVDMAGPYFYASIVCVTKTGSEQASATGISNLTGTCTAQTGTIWYDSCLPQIPGADIQPQAETAPAMVMAVASGTVDFICTDMPTALGACATYDDLTILDFSGTDDDFEVDEGEINIGISVVKGNTALKDAMDEVLAPMTADDFNQLMDEAISVQPDI
jgi:ABC-type amino acid transport substrate-binding protein